MNQKNNEVTLFIIDSFHIGGVTTFIQQYTQLLATSKRQSIILGMQDDLENPNAFFQGSVVHVIPNKMNRGLLGRTLSFIQFFYNLHILLRKNNNISTIFFSTPWSTFFSILHPIVWNKKRIITFYGAYHLEIEAAGEKNKIKLFFAKTIQYLGLISSNKVITFSKYAKSILITNFNKKIEEKIDIIPAFFSPSKHMKKYIKNKKTITIVNFGRAEKRKGIELLLNAIKILSEKGYSIKLYIASPVKYYQDNFEIIKLYEQLDLFESVHLLHAGNQKQKKQLLEKADVFVIPSIDLETFGLTIFEALSSGLIVLGTPVGAIKNILGEINKKLLSKETTPDSFAQTIEWFISLSNIEKQNLQKNALAYLEKKYSKESCEKKLLKCLEYKKLIV